jgi:hypothetical protein
MKVGRVLCATAGVIIFLAAGFQLQHLAWSTARIENDSVHRLSGVIVRVDGATVPIGVIPAGGSRFIRLPKRGEASLSVEFSALGEKHQGCAEYVEGEMYHVRLGISPELEVSCIAELGVLTSRIMLFELL